ncbi:MTH1187 family thiamine-binding protein [Seminibacterium arietis]|uniref:MTH1187 family thiamine-binding protein n=1 Tax=Seminibacterium arietis TaxID=1173502 RepID=A0ABW3I9N5_9PAST
MAVLELCVIPIGTDNTSVSDYIAKAIQVLQHHNIEFELNAMGTVMQGDIDLLLKATREIQETIFNTGVKRVYSVIKIDDRRDRNVNMQDKVSSVEKKLSCL